MAREIEAKLRVTSHDVVREQLSAAGAEFIERVVETNEIFDRPDGSLRARGCGLRVRSTDPIEGGRPRATLTFKGPRGGGAFKSREELEVEVDDADVALELLKKLGFIVILSFQKRRESWRWGSCRIELDEPPLVGFFVEIEGPDDEAIQDAREALGLGGAELENASYVRMLLQVCNEQGIIDRTLTLD